MISNIEMSDILFKKNIPQVFPIGRQRSQGTQVGASMFCLLYARNQEQEGPCIFSVCQAPEQNWLNGLGH